MIYEAPLVDARNRQIGWMGSILDITATRRAEERERHQVDTMTHHARLTMLGEVASTLAHELNQPLTAISSYNAGVINSLQRQVAPDPVLLRALQRLRNPVLFLSGHGDIPMAVEALKNGAFDFLEKPYSDNALAVRVEQALAVDAAMHRHDARAAEREARLQSLTERERDVMHRVAAGKLNKVIADELHVSVRTVEVHRARVYAKLGVRSAAEVATLLAG